MLRQGQDIRVGPGVEALAGLVSWLSREVGAVAHHAGWLMTEGSLPSAGQAGGVGLLELLRNACFCEDVLKEGTLLSFRIGEPELTFRGQRVTHAVPSSASDVPFSL